MHDLLQRVEKNGGSKVGTVLHLGAGSCREMEGYLRLAADKVVLVEANPEIAKRLDTRYRELPHVTTINSAVAAYSGEATLWVLNNPKESSIQRPTGVLEAYPNLRIADERSIAAVTLAELVGDIALDGTSPHLLLMEVQGAEASILASTSAELLQKFSWVAVRASAQAMYAGGGTISDIDVVLRRTGFKPVAGHHDVSESPFQGLLYSRDDNHIQLVALQNQLAEKSRQVESLQIQLDNDQIARVAQTAEYASLRQESFGYRQRIGELEAAIQRQAQANQDLARLAEDRKATVDQLSTSQTGHVSRIKTLEGEWHVHTQQINKLEVQIEGLMLERDGQTARIAALEAEAHRLAHVNEEQTQLAEGRRLDLEQLQIARIGQTAGYESLKQESFGYRQRILELEAEVQRQAQANQDLAQLAEERRTDVEQLTMDQHSRVHRIEELEAELGRLAEMQREQFARLEEEKKVSTQQLAELEAAARENAELAQVRRTAIEELVQKRDDQDSRIDELQAEAQRLTHASQQQTQLAASLRADIEQLTKDQTGYVARIKTLEGEWHEHEKQVKERDAEIVQLTQALRAQTAAAEGRLQEIKQLTKDCADRDAQLSKLESEKMELDYRQKLFDAEMFKAEAQLELIKDVLLREKEF